MKHNMPDKFHLEPCPFCASHNVELVEGTHYDIAYVECGDCTARGPVEEETDDALDNWNQRA